MIINDPFFRIQRPFTTEKKNNYGQPTGCVVADPVLQ
jgi:hypothetical protein